MNNDHENKNLLIEKILEIDALAKTKIEKEKKRENIELKQINSQMEESLKSLENRAKSRLENFKSFKLKEYEYEIEQLENEKTKNITNLKNIFNENEHIWIKNMFDNMLKIE